MDEPLHSRRLIATAYLLMACQGFLVYAPGFITPFVERDLGVPRAFAAAPSALMAIGLMAGGLVTPALRRRVGSQGAIRTAVATMMVSALLLAVPAIAAILLGAFILGSSIGSTIVFVNSSLGTGIRGGTFLTRANLASMAGGLLAPLALAFAATTVGWGWGMLVPVPFLALVLITIPASAVRDVPQAAAGSRRARLPVGFWLCWTFMALTIAVEFSFVAWGSQVADLRAGLGIANATALAALYTLGMFGGRLLVGFGPVLAVHRVGTLRAGTAMVIAGAAILWLAGSPLAAGIGLLIGGLGLAPAYPLAASLALAQAPDLPVQASSRLTAASGVAILAAPMALGVVASGAGVEAAWLMVIGVLAVALAVAFRFPDPLSAGPGTAAA
jgi:hypothetical protein